jgi:hypothetical protein
MFLHLIPDPDEKALGLLYDLTANDTGGDLACVFGRMDDFFFLSFALVRSAVDRQVRLFSRW